MSTTRAMAIRVENVSKVYLRYTAQRRFATLKSALLRGSLFKELTPEAAFPALSGVSFQVPAGTTFAVIGPNGSGKSTLLKLLAGVLKPSSGHLEVRGRVAALLELGAGFHPEVSGRENVIINGMMLGLSRRAIEERLPDIVRFAELEDFVDAPVKTYSSGMYVRLAFSVAVAVDPDVLLIDEVLAVGDEAFTHKCLHRFHELKRRGCTIVLVTHGLELAASLADEALLLEAGRATARGFPREVVDAYRGHVEARETVALSRENTARQEQADLGQPPASDPSRSPAEVVPAASPAPAPERSPEGAPADAWTPRRWGNRRIEIATVELKDASGAPATVFHTGRPLTIDMEVACEEPQHDFVFGVAFYTQNGQLAYGTNTLLERYLSRHLCGRARVCFRIAALELLAGRYSLNVAVHRQDGTPLDYWHSCLSFAVRSESRAEGIAQLGHSWEFSEPIHMEVQSA